MRILVMCRINSVRHGTRFNRAANSAYILLYYTHCERIQSGLCVTGGGGALGLSTISEAPPKQTDKSRSRKLLICCRKITEISHKI